MKFDLDVNGRTRSVEAEEDAPLLWVLREDLGLTGTKFGCGLGQCGACTVHLDGNAIRSCITPVSSVGVGRIETIEQMTADAVGKHVQRAWLQLGVVQCGYCQSGQIMSATALLRENKAPQDAEIDAAMSGNICRCGTYQRIRAAIHAAAEMVKADAGSPVSNG
ncbi:(2Fe-2S)-binding protein [Sphingomonas oleivorans]|uniref:(2Fe-2S)-binding protein n=1 Tax=Sphingomonas oleivorans TaxID=1735121 RepID=A0A2T5FYY2_9SPHN|nr:(2Fe-2S)-binding protein [Sphingomonas oleivorans]PTQ11817.1 (2Fe-2S)-binding protein [Sphingomonas oleivorans]